MEADHGCPAPGCADARRGGAVRRSHVLAEFERVVPGDTPLLFRALPHHPRKTFQRHQRLAGIGPLLQFFDRDVIERLPAGAPRKQRARDVDHVRRTRTFVTERRAAVLAEAPRGLGGLVLVARDGALAACDAKALAPASDIGGVGRTMRAAAASRMIMPGPARRHVDFEADLAAQALALCDPRHCCRRSCHLRFPCLSLLRADIAVMTWFDQ